jgi:hypothetical protein
VPSPPHAVGDDVPPTTGRVGGGPPDTPHWPALHGVPKKPILYDCLCRSGERHVSPSEAPRSPEASASIERSRLLQSWRDTYDGWSVRRGVKNSECDSTIGPAMTDYIGDRNVPGAPCLPSVIAVDETCISQRPRFEPCANYRV